MDFSQTLQTHLYAIEQRDLDLYLSTISHDEELSLIMPNGTFIQGYEAVAKMNREWFADPDWRLEAAVLRTIETDEMGLALLLVQYHDLTPDGEPFDRQYYLNLIFSHVDDEWLLVHDQNTFLKEDPLILDDSEDSDDLEEPEDRL